MSSLYPDGPGGAGYSATGGHVFKSFCFDLPGPGDSLWYPFHKMDSYIRQDVTMDLGNGKTEIRKSNEIKIFSPNHVKLPYVSCCAYRILSNQ